MASQETVSTEEVNVLRHQMAKMYEAWMSGQAPPSSIRNYLNMNMSPPIQVSTNDPIYPPGFGPFINTSNIAGTSTVRPLNTPMMSSYPHTHQYSSHVEAEKAVKNEEHEEMARSMKNLKQSTRDMQGLGGHKIPDRTSLANMSKKTIGNFREYAIRWREQAARVKTPMKESEMINVFLKVQEPVYFHYLLSVVEKTFAEVIKIGEMVKNGIKSGKIVSQAALKATTQVIKIGSRNLRGKKMKEDVANVMSDKQKSPRGPLYQSAPPQYHHYLPMQDTQYSIISPQYAVYNAQQYAYPPNYPQWRALTYQNVHPSQNFRAPYNPRPTQGFEGGQRPRNNFTPIGESYTSLFNKLKYLKMIEPISQNYVDPHAKGFNPTSRCAYHSDAPGHRFEDCRNFKKMIVVQNDDPPNVTKNPLPAHSNVHFIEMICDDKEYDNSEEKTIEIGGAFTKDNVQRSG
ncbi:hypothetical protein KY290_003763 [Solanum tuberosum]|uniref:Gag-pro-like protein n=1 Tax=Solanum tuberosum TaxID=4113 RepID=A0ABQ7WTU0_SOLTU|nr:hypothetical protein KY290_003763 [Solanum tuberosum]